MGGQIDWSALPIVAELIGFTDLETLLDQLCELRDRNTDGE
jgi:hypothetical protein